jgi:hypothetical protein
LGNLKVSELRNLCPDTLDEVPISPKTACTASVAMPHSASLSSVTSGYAYDHLQLAISQLLSGELFLLEAICQVSYKQKAVEGALVLRQHPMCRARCQPDARKAKLAFAMMRDRVHERQSFLLISVPQDPSSHCPLYAALLATFLSLSMSARATGPRLSTGIGALWGT